MNEIAQELNSQLDKTIIGPMLSDLGRRMYFPRGIVAQSAEATKKADDLNATIGMAQLNKATYTLPLLQGMIPHFSSKELVAYAPTAGVPALRQKWQDLLRIKNPLLGGKEISLPIVVAGITAGIFQMAELFVNEGDSVIVPNMFWGNYRMSISERRGGVINTYDMFRSDVSVGDGSAVSSDVSGGAGAGSAGATGPAGNFNVQALKKAIEAQVERGCTKLIILFNFPNNPTGYSPLNSEAEEICHTLARFADSGLQILSVHDDAYFGLFYNADCFGQSLFARFADLHPNILALKIDGATKEDYAWGFRVAFMTFASQSMKSGDFAPLVQKVMGSVRATVSNCSSLGQNALLKMLSHPNYNAEQSSARNMLAERYALVQNILSEKLQGSEASALLEPLPFNSGYFMAFKLLSISAEKLRQALLEQGIGTIAIGDSVLRVAYSAVDADELPRLYTSIFETALALSQTS